jgi:hypothetical protein
MGRASFLGLGLAFGTSVLAASAANAIQVNDGDLIIALAKNGIDAIYDFGPSVTPGTTKQFTLPTGSNGFPAGPSGALSEGAVANAMGVPKPGNQEFDPALGVMVPVATLRFTTTTTDPLGATDMNRDTEISNAANFLQSTPVPAASGWVPSLPGFNATAISSSANSVILHATQNGSYSSSTGPGNNGQNKISGSLSFTTDAVIGAGGSLMFPLWDATAGTVSVGGSIPTSVTRDGTLKFSEAGGILTVTLLAIPEPGTFVLLAAGLCGLAARRAARRS